MTDFDKAVAKVNKLNQSRENVNQRVNDMAQRYTQLEQGLNQRYGLAEQQSAKQGQLNYLQGSNQEIVQVDTSPTPSTADKIKRYNPSLGEHVKDAGIGLAQGIVSVGGSALTIADVIASGGHNLVNASMGIDDYQVNRNTIRDALGADFGRTNQILEDNKSEAYKNNLDYIQEKNSQGTPITNFFGALKDTLTTPSVAIPMTAQSLPIMMGGTAIGRGLVNKGLVSNPLNAIAIGHGVMGGLTHLNEQNSKDNLTVEQFLAGVGIGAVTGATTRLAMGTGKGDIDSIGSGIGSGNVNNVIKSGLKEIPEEATQTFSERVFTDVANNEVSDFAHIGTEMGIASGSTPYMSIGMLPKAILQDTQSSTDNVDNSTKLQEITTHEQFKLAYDPRNKEYNPLSALNYVIGLSNETDVDGKLITQLSDKIINTLNILKIKYEHDISNTTDANEKAKLEKAYNDFLNSKYNPTIEAYSLFNNATDTSQVYQNILQKQQEYENTLAQQSQTNQTTGVVIPTTVTQNVVQPTNQTKQVNQTKTYNFPDQKVRNVNDIKSLGFKTPFVNVGTNSLFSGGTVRGDTLSFMKVLDDDGLGGMMNAFTSITGGKHRNNSAISHGTGFKFDLDLKNGDDIATYERIGNRVAELAEQHGFNVVVLAEKKGWGKIGQRGKVKFIDGGGSHLDIKVLGRIKPTQTNNTQQGTNSSTYNITSNSLSQSTIKQTPMGRWTSDDPVMARIIAVESMGNANADRGNTRYKGLMQIDSTNKKDYNAKNYFDPQENFELGKRVIIKNTQSLERKGIPITPAHVYLTHNQGSYGFEAIYKVATGQLPESVLDKPLKGGGSIRNNMNNNGGKGKTAKEFITYWEQRLENNYQDFVNKYGATYVGLSPNTNVNQESNTTVDNNQSVGFSDYFKSLLQDSDAKPVSDNTNETSTQNQENTANQDKNNIIQDIMRNYSKFTIEQIDSLTILNDEQKSILRNLIETKGQLATHKNMNDVSKNFFDGEKGKTRLESNRGVNEYVQMFDNAIATGDARTATYLMSDLERFAHSHQSKAETMAKAFNSVGDGETVFIAPDKQGNWNVVTGLDEDTIRQYGGLKIDNKSGKLLSFIQNESSILNQLRDSYKPVLNGLISETYSPKQRVQNRTSGASNVNTPTVNTQQTSTVNTPTNTNSSRDKLDLNRGKQGNTYTSLSNVDMDRNNIGKTGWLANPYNIDKDGSKSGNPFFVSNAEEQADKYFGLLKKLSKDDNFVKALQAERNKTVVNGGVINKAMQTLLDNLPDDLEQAKRYIQNFQYNPNTSANTGSNVNTSFSSYDKFDNNLAETNTDKSYVVDADVSDKTSHENVILAKTKRKDKHGVDTFSDSNPNSKKLVDSFIQRLAEERDKGQELVFPKNGVSKHLETSAPKTYAYLNQRLKDEFGYDNTQRVFEDKPTDKERSAVEKGKSKNTKTARPAMKNKGAVKLKPNELKQREKDYLSLLNDKSDYITSGIKNLNNINQAVEDYLNGNTEYESNKSFINSLGLGDTLSNILNQYIQARQLGYEDKSINDLFNMGNKELQDLAEERLNVVDDKEVTNEEDSELETTTFDDVTIPNELLNNKVVLDDVLELLQHIDDSRVSKNEKRYHLELIDGLLNYTPEFKLELVKQDSKETHKYDDKTKTLKIYLPVSGGNIFELISRGLIQSTNAQVLNDLDSKDARKLNRELDKIRDVINVYIRDNNPEFDANITYLLSQALENNTGLISIGLSNKGVINFLKEIKTEEKNVKTNLFRRLVRAISNFIGMTNGKETQNLYERLVELSARASDLQNATVDRDLYKASEDGKLTILQNISDNDVQKELNKAFEYRNHIISAFTQQTGKDKPLASIKDVMGKLRLNLTQGLQALHSKLPTKAQREQVKDFIDFHQEFVGHLQDTFRAKQKTEKGDFGYQDLKSFLAVDDEIDENVYTAMSLAVYDFIIENGNHTMNTDKEIKKLLNLEPEDESYIHKDIREQYRYIGEPSSWSANKLGKSIIKSLGLKHNGLSNPELQSRLEMSVGQWAINAMQSADLVHIHTIQTKDHFNNIFDIGGEISQEFNTEGVVHFVSMTDIKGLNHNPLLTEIVKKNFGTKGYLAEVFGFESRLTYPKLEKPTEVKLKIKGTDSVVTQKQEELLKRVQEEPVRLAKETVDSIQYLYDNFNDDLLEMFGASISEEELKYMHIDDRDGAIAGAEAKLRGLQNALGFVSGLDKNENGEYQQFYLPTYVAKNTRWHFDSNVFNFQTDKIHRAMGEYANFKTTMDTQGLSLIKGKLVYDDSAFFNADGKTTDLTRFFRALGENLEGSEDFIEKQDVNKLYARGYTVDKMASIDFIPALISWFNQDEVKQAVEATKVLLNKPSELNQEHINSIKKFIAMGEMGASSYRALIEYTRLVQAIEQGQEFTTYIGLGSDGINNGSAISYVLNGSLDISDKFSYQVGLIPKTNEQNVDNYFDTRYDHTIGDYYESFANRIENFLEQNTDPTIKAIKALHKSAKGRKLAKDVLIPFGYSAGIGRISQITVGRFLQDIRDAQVKLAVSYMKLQESKEQGTITEEDYINQMANIEKTYTSLQDNMRELLGKEYNLPKIDDMLETSLESKYVKQLTDLYNEHINTALEKMLNEYADKFIISRNKNIAIHETMYGIYQSAYRSFESALRQKYYNKYKAEIKRKKPELDAIQLQIEIEKKINNIGFTQQEIEEEILKPIAKLIPKVDSPFSFIHNETERESRFDAFKWVKQLVDKDNIETIGYQYNEQGELQATSTHLPLAQKILESTGVFTNSAQTQGSDAYITTFTSADSKDVVINVHDADIGGIGNYTSMAIKQNEMFFKGMAQYHANLASVTGLENTLNNLFNLDDSIENKDNVIGGILVNTLNGLFKGDRSGFLDYVYNFKGDRNSETYDEDKLMYVLGLYMNKESRDKIISAVMSYVVQEAKETDLIKLNQLKNLHAVHQYGGEDGQYYITDADRKLIDEQIDAVEKVYAKFDKYLTMSEHIEWFKYNKQSQQFARSFVANHEDQTETGYVTIVDGLNHTNGVAKAKSMGGIYSMRLPNTDKHFGNPFTSNRDIARQQGLKLVKNTKEAVKNYITWVLTSPDTRASWIREQINSGVLLNKPILYYKELNQVSHANALDSLIHDFGTINYVAKPEPIFDGEPQSSSNNEYSPTEVSKTEDNINGNVNQDIKQSEDKPVNSKSTKPSTVLGLHEQLEKIINSKVSQEVKDKAEQLLSYDNDYDIERKSLGNDVSDYILSKDKIIINTSGLSGDKGSLVFLERLERALNELGVAKVNTTEEVVNVPTTNKVDLITQIEELANNKTIPDYQRYILNYLLNRIDELNPNISFGFDNTIIENGYYDHTLNKIGINQEIWNKSNSEIKAGLAIHELYHAITDTTLYRYKENPNSVSKKQANAIQLLEQMRENVANGLLKDNIMTDKLSYAVSSLNEFIAHGMSDRRVKEVIAKYTQVIKQTKTTKIKDALNEFFTAVMELLGFNTSESKAYKDFIQAVSQIESKYSPIEKPVLRSFSKYTIATDKVNNLSAVDVLKSLDATGLDSKHNEHLDNIISNIIGGYYDKNETNKKKVDKSVKKLQSKPLNHGYALTDKEAYVYAILEEISYEYLKSQAGNLPTSELHKVYDEVSRQFTSVDKLYDGFNALSKDEQSLLRKKYNFVFGAKNANKPHRFMALTLASQEFRELMNQDRKRVNKKSDTWFSKVMNYLIGALNMFKDNRLGKTNKDAVTSLMAKLSQIDVQSRNRLDDLVATSWNFLTSPLNKANTYASKAVIKSLDLVNIEKLKKLRDVTKTTVAFGGNFTTKAWLNNFTRRASNNKQPLNFIGELLNEMSATTTMKSYIEGMLRHTQYLGKQRSQIKTATKNVLNSLFKSELSAQQRHAITVGLLRTDVSSLFDYYNKPTVRKLLLDTDLRQEEIEKLYQRIEANENGNDMIKQAKSLAYYMVSERAVEHLVKNPTGIAMGLNTDYVHLENTPNQQLIKDLDALISLLALEYVPVQQQSILFDLFSEEDNALFEVLHLHKGMIDTAKEEFADNPLNIAKGYLPQITNRYKSISFANLEEVTELENNGWVRINDDVLHQDQSDNTGERVLMFHDDMSYRSYVSGALDMIDTANKGTTVYTFNQHQGELNVAMGEKRKRILNRKHISHRDYDPVKQPTAMISSFDSEGYVTGLRYEMSGFLRDNYLQRDNDFAEVLSTYMGQQFYKTNINEHQHNLLDGIYADYKANFRKQSKEFITISGESNDPEMQRVWRMLPYNFRQNAKDKFGSNVVVIRSTVFNATFGFKAYSIADMFDKVFEDKNVLEKILTGILSAVFGDKAKAKTLKAERLIEYLTGQAKDFIVIRSGQVLLGNIISNLLLLGLSGINPLQLVKEFAFAWKNGKVYADIEKRLAEVNAEILAKGDKSELLKERNRLQQQLKDNPLREFMQAGLMSTIVEDVEQETDIEKYSKSVYEEKLDKFVNHVPKPIRTIFDYATLNTNTEPYKFLSEATQFSDFGAKIVLARHLMKQGKSLNEAISVAQDHFINYDVPTSRGLDYMNRVGLMMFTKFFLRFQKIMFNLLHKKLATSIIQHNLVENLTDFQGIYEPFMLNRFGNPFEMPVHTYFTSIDDILTFKLFS